jgi:tRNA nucleotidyltransferase (CCA-adding enzyme)
LLLQIKLRGWQNTPLWHIHDETTHRFLAAARQTGKAGMTGQTSRQSDPAAGWEHFPHQADVGVRGFACTLERAFEQAACAMTAVVTELERVTPATAVSIRCSAPDRELLLFDWLNALIYEMATRHMLFSQFEVGISDGELRATARGEPVDIVRHEPRVEIKGATLTELQVAQDADGRWRAQCILDV